MYIRGMKFIVYLYSLLELESQLIFLPFQNIY